MPYSQGAQDALLTWINDGFSNSQRAHQLGDLADGVILAEVLQDLDPSFNISELELPTAATSPRWLVRKKNLITIHKALFKFIHRECSDLEFLSKRTDFHSLADGPTPESIAKLISVMIAVAFLGPDPGKYVDRLQERGRFEQATMREIQHIIIEIEGERSKATTKADAYVLALEQERAELLEQLKVTKLQNADIISRLEHLQESYESLKADEAEHLKELYELREATEDGASDSQIIKSLKNKIKEQDDLITSHEAQAEEDHKTKESLQSQIATLTKKAELARQLGDELNELRPKTLELSKKANAAERLRQKLENQQGLATEVQNLRFEKDELLKKATEYDKLAQRNTSLEQALQEIRSSHAQAEETLFLLNNQKRMLEESNRTLANEITRLTELRSNDERFIAELQEQAASQIAADHTGGAISLEQELEGTQQQPGLVLELSRLKAENALLKRGVGSAETSQLRADLEEEQRKYQELRNKYTEIVERHSVAQDQITALVNDAAGEGTRAFNELRTQLLQANMDAKREAQRANDLQTQVSDKERDLLVARTELSAMSKDGTEALEDLKATDELVSASLRDELDALRTRVKSLVSDNELQRSQLLEAFLAKDRLQKEIEAVRDSKPKVENKNINDEVIAEEINKTSEKIEKLRDRLRQRQEQLEKAEQERYELQRKLKTALAGGVSASQKAAAEQTIRNLQRENALITSAWYDLASRLQSNHVVLQRRNDTPRSWLNKQRQLVNSTPRR